jgi:hypothetical protein
MLHKAETYELSIIESFDSILIVFNFAGCAYLQRHRRVGFSRNSIVFYVYNYNKKMRNIVRSFF